MIPTARSQALPAPGSGSAADVTRVSGATMTTYQGSAPQPLHRAGGLLSSTKIQLHPEKFNYFSLRYETRKTRKPLRHNKFKDFSKR